MNSSKHYMSPDPCACVSRDGGFKTLFSLLPLFYRTAMNYYIYTEEEGMFKSLKFNCFKIDFCFFIIINIRSTHRLTGHPLEWHLEIDLLLLVLTKVLLHNSVILIEPSPALTNYS